MHDEYLDLAMNRASTQLLPPPPGPTLEDRLRVAERVVESYVPTAQTLSTFERLHVLVCGRCQSVFHLIDQFKSHEEVCQGTESSVETAAENRGSPGADEAVAITLWSNTLRRKMEQAGVLDDAFVLGVGGMAEVFVAPIRLSRKLVQLSDPCPSASTSAPITPKAAASVAVA